MKKIILLILVFALAGCSSIGWMACGDRGVDKKYGFLWLKSKCYGDKYCDKCKEWVHPFYNCDEVCK